MGYFHFAHSFIHVRSEGVFKSTLHLANFVVQLKSGHYWLLSCFFFHVMRDDTHTHLRADLFIPSFSHFGTKQV